jgi:hypothetical protein
VTEQDAKPVEQLVGYPASPRGGLFLMPLEFFGFAAFHPGFVSQPQTVLFI